MHLATDSISGNPAPSGLLQLEFEVVDEATSPFIGAQS